jgi:hypothetical protein
MGDRMLARVTDVYSFIDNVYCFHNKTDVSAEVLAPGKTKKFWGGCRLQRVWKTVGENEENPDGRKRKRRLPGQCPAKFRVTIQPGSGTRILERSKEGHSHDLDHIDAIKRPSGIRDMVVDPLFSGWESGSVLAYLKDPVNAPPNLPNILDDAGGRYLERREIINIFSQKLRAAYPGADQSSLRKQKEKYEGVKTCNVKGCNKCFKDAKELARHKKDEHELKKHDHGDKMYTCPRKDCHRHKKSKGFATVVALREHMLRMRHWGLAHYHATEGAKPIEVVTQDEQMVTENGHTIDAELSPSTVPTAAPALPDQLLPDSQGPDLSFLSAIPSTGGNYEMPVLNDHDDMVPFSVGNSIHDSRQRQQMMQRLQSLESAHAKMEMEIQKLRNALYND